MKKILTFTLLFCLLTPVYSQTSENYSFKVEYLYGKILKHNKHLENLVKEPSSGLQLSAEWLTSGAKPWHNYFNLPSVGLSLSYIDLSNRNVLGEAFSLYPYIHFPIVKTNFFKLNIKLGAGASYVTKTYSDAIGIDFNHSNGAIGSNLNVFLAGGGNLDFRLTKGLSLAANYELNHISNGSIVQPNSGINMLNGYIGLKYSPNYRNHISRLREVEDVPRKFTYEITVAGGVRQLYYKDDKSYPIGSVAFAVHRPLTNTYQMGLGADLFYDGVFGAVNSAPDASNNTSKFMRTYVTSDEFKNKIRAGISWQNELLIGRLTAGLHMGIYIYDPVKKLEPYNDAKNGDVKKGLIYSYNIDDEDGWLYTRLVAKYQIEKHLFLSVGLKTHLQKAEFIEWGLGYKF